MRVTSCRRFFIYIKGSQYNVLAFLLHCLALFNGPLLSFLFVDVHLLFLILLLFPVYVVANAFFLISLFFLYVTVSLPY